MANTPTTPNRAVLMAISLVCVACAGAVAVLAHAIVLEESGSPSAAWIAVAITVGIMALILTLLLRLRKKAPS